MSEPTDDEAAGVIAVADQIACAVYVFSASDGTFLHTLGDKGRSEGQFLNPRGLAFDSKASLWVADSSNSRLQWLRQYGRTFGGTLGKKGKDPGQLGSPTDVLVVGSHVLVADGSNHRIQVYQDNGDV